MKNKMFKVVAVCMLLMSVTSNTYSQKTATPITAGHGSTKPAKIARAKVPKAVTDVYVKEYVMPGNEYWYGYPEFDFGNDWYWYNPALYEYEHPEYYLVEFEIDKTPHKVIYSKTGKKIATHRKLKTELPAAVTIALGKGAYSSWTVGKEKEEIFRDTEMDKMKVYKIEVTKEKEKHDLFYSSDGDLLKDKAIKP